MVKKYCYLLFILGISAFLQGMPVEINIEIDSDLASEHQPITGKIMVVHSQNDPVEEGSFTLNGQKLKTQFLSQGMTTAINFINGKRNEISRLVSCYRFEIPGQAKGKHKLDPISVKVGSTFIKSDPIAYQIHAAETTEGFTLVGELLGPTPIYPGQKITAVYRLILKTPIEPIREHLPLLELEGFQKIGERRCRAFRRGNAIIREYVQELVAKEPKVFEIEESFIEGLAYQEDFFARRVYKKPKLRAKFDPLKIEVIDFPVEGKPASFEGAIGDFNMEVELISDHKVALGDKLELKVSFKGKGVETLNAPHFIHQRQLTENFRLSDLPALGKQSGSEKSFQIDIRPMKEGITEIPSLEFSFFNPEKNQYETVKSRPIPLDILSLPLAQSEQDSKGVETEEFQVSPTQDVLFQVEPEKDPDLIDISGVFPISEIELQKKSPDYFKWQFLLVLCGFLGVQLGFKKWYHRGRENPKKSLDMLKEAFKYSNELQKYHVLLEKAFDMRIQEKGIDRTNPTNRTLKEIELFLEDMQKRLFSGNQNFNFKESQKKAKTLYKRIGNLHERF